MKKKGKNKFSVVKLVIFLCAVVFGVFVFSSSYSGQLEAKEKQAILEDLTDRYNQKVSENKEIKEVYELLKSIQNEDIQKIKADARYKEALTYIEKIARENYNYIKPGERVFVNITGE